MCSAINSVINTDSWRVYFLLKYTLAPSLKKLNFLSALPSLISNPSGTSFLSGVQGRSLHNSLGSFYLRMNPPPPRFPSRNEILNTNRTYVRERGNHCKSCQSSLTHLFFLQTWAFPRTIVTGNRGTIGKVVKVPLLSFFPSDMSFPLNYSYGERGNHWKSCQSSLTYLFSFRHEISPEL